MPVFQAEARIEGAVSSKDLRELKVDMVLGKNLVKINFDQSGIVRTLYKLEFQIRNRDSCRVLPKFGIYFVKHREVNRLVCW
jgi:hypothetical protein